MKIFKPVAHPGILLFGGVLGFFSYIAFQLAASVEFAPAGMAIKGLSIALGLTSAYLLICGVLGIRMDLSLKRVGVLTYARIYAVIEGHRGKGMPEHWLRISFEFTDASGTTRKGEFVENYQPGTRKWKAGDTAKIRYHPDEPSIYRWIGTDES